MIVPKLKDGNHGRQDELSVRVSASPEKTKQANTPSERKTKSSKLTHKGDHSPLHAESQYHASDRQNVRAFEKMGADKPTKKKKQCKHQTRKQASLHEGALKSKIIATCMKSYLIGNSSEACKAALQGANPGRPTFRRARDSEFPNRKTI